MLTRLLESALIGLYNRRRRAREAGHPETERLPPAGADAVTVGHALPWSPPPGTTFSAAPSRGSAGPGPPVALPLAARRRHLYAIGATGCGKTNFLLRLIEDDIAHGRTLCVLDLRGDLVDRVLLRVAARTDPATVGTRVALIDLRQSETVVGFNPLAGPGDAYGRALHALAVLRRNAESWGVQLEETLRSALLALAEGGWTLMELEPLLSDAAFRQRALSGVTDPLVRAFFARYGEMSADKQMQWRLPVLNKVSAFLSIPPVRRMLAERAPRLSLPALLDGAPGAILLVSLAVDRLHGAAHLLGGLLVSALQNAVLARVDAAEERRVPVHLYVDEFENLVGDDFETMLAEGRRFGLGLTLSHQNLSQMPEGLRQTILNNAHTQLYFQTGAIDAAELAREVVPHPGETREAVRQALTTQRVGEAYLLRRGEPGPTARVRLLPCPDPKVPPSRVAALRAAALAAYGRPAAEVDREIQERLDAPQETPARGGGRAPQRRPSPAPSEPAAAAPTAEEPAVETPSCEVRHRRRPGRFALGGKGTAPEETSGGD